ncbi:MAG: calcium/sodium antiporter [Chloroflexota bacterium]|nr:calcium/sodium antiporter [Chloroflexota bacterium]
MDLITWVLLVAGLVLLVVGAEALVRGASRLAATVGVSPLVIGLTIVAFGTSSPEMAVSAQSALAGQGDMAVGNVVGSNIFNILFILGVSALVAPLIVAQRLVRLDVPLMIGVSLLLLLLAWDGTLGRMDGFLLFAGIIAYTLFSIYESRGESAQVQAEYAQEFGEDGAADQGLRAVVIQLAFIIVGLGMLLLGSRWLLEGAVALARTLGVSELVIGLTIVAAGTSLPEVATSVLASLRGERDIAVGNVIGSNLFNILAVLGLAGLLAPDGVHVTVSALRVDIPVMIAVALASLPIFFTGTITRGMGALFLTFYVAYTAYLILGATQSAALPAFTATMTFGVLPLSALRLSVLTVRTLRANRRLSAEGNAA